jgi:hypothetical protein
MELSLHAGRCEGYGWCEETAPRVYRRRCIRRGSRSSRVRQARRFRGFNHDHRGRVAPHIPAPPYPRHCSPGQGMRSRRIFRLQKTASQRLPLRTHGSPPNAGVRHDGTSSGLLPSSGGAGRRRTISYLKRYACHVDLSNRCYESYPSVKPIIAWARPTPQRDWGRLDFSKRSHSLATFLMSRRIGFVDGWHPLQLLDARRRSLLWFPHPVAHEEHRPACTGPSGALLTQRGSVESGVIARSRKPDLDRTTSGVARNLWLDFITDHKEPGKLAISNSWRKINGNRTAAS